MAMLRMSWRKVENCTQRSSWEPKIQIKANEVRDIGKKGEKTDLRGIKEELTH